jgi:multiple sugar transport system permease protein/putative aldouronate transport system permease protein
MRRSTRPIAERGENLFYAANDILLCIALLIVVYPLVYIVSSSFSHPNAVSAGSVWLFPVRPSLAGYLAIFENHNILTGYLNSILYTVLGTSLNVVLTLAAAYPLARSNFWGKKAYMFLFLFTMFFNGGLIPTYILMSKLHLVNTRLIMILWPAISVYNVVITRTFIQSSISPDLIEAAQIDGMNDFGILLHIVAPLSKAIIAVIGLFYAVQHWNSYFNAFIYLSNRKLFPLQLVLRQILVLNQIDSSAFQTMSLQEMEAREGMAELLKYSLIVVASVPVLAIYPFVQKHFVKGVMIGSLKG